MLAGLNYTFVVADVLTLVIGMGVLGWVLGMFYNLAFRRYLPKEKNEKESDGDGSDEESQYAEYVDKEDIRNNNIK